MSTALARGVSSTTSWSGRGSRRTSTSGSESVRAVATLKRFPSGSLHGFEVERTRAPLHEMSWTAAQDWPGVDRCVGDIHNQPTGSPVWVYWRTPLVALERSL